MTIQAAPIDVSALQRLRSTGSDVAVLDVRTSAEYDAAHIPGSLNIPLSQLPDVLDRVARVEALVVTCQTGPRAEQAIAMLRRGGAAEARVLDGGFSAWSAQGGAVEQGRPRWAMERQVRLTAGSLVLVGILSGLRFPKARVLSGAIGGGLVFSAVSNTCTMARVLGQLPYNRRSRSEIATALDGLAGR